jgi:hypothetical protein
MLSSGNTQAFGPAPQLSARKMEWALWKTACEERYPSRIALFRPCLARRRSDVFARGCQRRFTRAFSRSSNSDFVLHPFTNTTPPLVQQTGASFNQNGG